MPRHKQGVKHMGFQVFGELDEHFCTHCHKLTLDFCELNYNDSFDSTGTIILCPECQEHFYDFREMMEK